MTLDLIIRPTRHTDANPFVVDPGRAGRVERNTATIHNLLQQYHELFPTYTGHRSHAVPCTTPAGEHHTKKASLHKHALKGFTTHAELELELMLSQMAQKPMLLGEAYSFKRLGLLRLPRTSPFSPDLMRVTHARPLNSAELVLALPFVPFGIARVRFRHTHTHTLSLSI